MYFVLGYLAARSGHWTRDSSARYWRILPVRERLSTRHRDSTNTIRQGEIPVRDNNQVVTTTGRQVPAEETINWDYLNTLSSWELIN